MKFQQQIACLIFIPSLLIFFIGLVELQFIYQQMNNIIIQQGDSYYNSEISQLKQVQKAAKLHLDSNHQSIYTQIQSLLSLELQLINKKVKINSNFIPLTVSNLALNQKTLPQTYVEMINQNDLSVSSWNIHYLFLLKRKYQRNCSFEYLRSIDRYEDLDKTSQDELYEQAVIDALQRAFIYESKNAEGNSFHIIDIFRAYEQTGFFYKIPSSIERNFLFESNSTCPIQQDDYEPRCRPWYVNSKMKLGVFLDAPQLYNTTSDQYFGTSFCSQILDRQQGFLGAMCGRVDMLEFNNIIFEVNTRSSQFFTMHRDSRQVTLYFKENRTFSQFHISDETKNPYYHLLPQNYEQLIAGLQTNYSSYNYASDDNLVIVKLIDGYTAIISPITMIDQTYATNTITNLTLNKTIPFTEQYRYIDSSTPKIINNAFFIFQILSSQDILKEYNELSDFINQLYISCMVISSIITLLGIIFIYYYSIQISHRLHSPIDKFLLLFQSLKISDILYIDIFEDSDLGSIDTFQSSQHHSNSLNSTNQTIIDDRDNTLKHFLTSKDTTTLYEAFKGLFQMVRYSNSEYYNINYGSSLLKWIKSCQFFTKQNNRRAIGICYMNIGNVHFNCERYGEALEAFGAAILQANYELGMYSDDEDFLIQNQKNEESIKCSDSNERDEFIADYRKDLMRLRFDRQLSYLKALKMFCLHNPHLQCWSEYVKSLKQLLHSAKTMKETGNNETVYVLIQIELSFGYMMMKRLKSSTKIMDKVMKSIKLIVKNQISNKLIQSQSQQNLLLQNPNYYFTRSLSFKHRKNSQSQPHQHLSYNGMTEQTVQPLDLNKTTFDGNSMRKNTISKLRSQKLQRQQSIKFGNTANRYTQSSNQTIPSKIRNQARSTLTQQQQQQLPISIPLNTKSNKYIGANAAITPEIFSLEQQLIVDVTAKRNEKKNNNNNNNNNNNKNNNNNNNIQCDVTIPIKPLTILSPIVIDQSVLLESKQNNINLKDAIPQPLENLAKQIQTQDIKLEKIELVQYDGMLDSPKEMKAGYQESQSNQLQNNMNSQTNRQYVLSQREINSQHDLLSSSAKAQNNNNNNMILNNAQEYLQQYTKRNSSILNKFSKYSISNAENPHYNNHHITRDQWLNPSSASFHHHHHHHHHDHHHHNVSQNLEVSANPILPNKNNSPYLISSPQKDILRDINHSNAHIIYQDITAKKETISEQNQQNNNTIQDEMTNRQSISVKRDEYEYSIPFDILQASSMIQEARIMILQGKIYDACETLTQILEEHFQYFSFQRYEAVSLIETCFKKQQIESMELKEFQQNLNKSLYFDASIVIDIYDEDEIVETAQSITAMILEEILHRQHDRVGISVISDVIDVVITPMAQNLLNISQCSYGILSIKLIVEEYRQHFRERPSLYISIINQINLILQNYQSFPHSKQQTNFIDNLLYKKYIICITQIDLWDDIELHRMLLHLLHLNNIELLIIDVRSLRGNDQEQPEIPPFFDSPISTIIKLFKNVTHLYSYLCNMRLCTETYGIPLIVEKFQSGFIYFREVFLLLL